MAIRNVFGAQSIRQKLLLGTLFLAIIPVAVTSVIVGRESLNSGRADAAATDMSSTKWFVAQNPDQYISGGYGWDAQTYSCAVKKGDSDFLHFVDIVFREAMTGVDFATYAASFKKWFGEDPPAPVVGFPSEMR